jgi:hypothetical protein
MQTEIKIEENSKIAQESLKKLTSPVNLSNVSTISVDEQ